MDDSLQVPKCLYHWIPREDPFRITKYCQIKYWWNSFWDVYRCSELDALVGVFSREDCWKREDNLHGVKLDREVLGKRLYAAATNYSYARKLKLACRFCLEDDIARLILPDEKQTSMRDLCSSAFLSNAKHKFFEYDTLAQFWLHFLVGRMESLQRDLHKFEYGFKCALGMLQPQAMEFFWRKITELPEHEMSSQKKDDIIVYSAVYAVMKYSSRPEIFEFAFSQIKPEKYAKLLQHEFHSCNTYLSLSALLNAIRFDEFKALFDCLLPTQISVNLYSNWIYFLGLNHLSGRYMDAAVSAFMHMWKRAGFDEHRSQIHTELAISTPLQSHLLVPLISKGYTDVVWTILDSASLEAIKDYITSKNAGDIINLLLKMNDNNNLFRFLRYQTQVFSGLS